jgi:hypothetical protein
VSNPSPERLAGEYRHVNMLALAVVCACAVAPQALMALRHRAPHVLPVCASQALFGRPCPLCGLTRGLAVLARGDAGAASRLNPLSVPVAGLMTAEILYRATAILCTGRIRRRVGLVVRVDAAFHVLLAALYIGYSISLLAGWTWPAALAPGLMPAGAHDSATCC